MTVLALIIIFILCGYEVNDYLSSETVEYLTVDNDAQTKLKIDFDVTLHRIPCNCN